MLGLPYLSTTGWGLRQQTFIVSQTGGWVSKSKGWAGLVSSQALQAAILSLCPHLVTPLCVSVS